MKGLIHVMSEKCAIYADSSWLHHCVFDLRYHLCSDSLPRRNRLMLLRCGARK